MADIEKIKIKKEKLPSSVKLTITISKADWQIFEEEILDNLKLSLDIPGFRAGKAPKNLVKNQIEESKLTQEILERILPLSYEQVVRQEKIEPIGSPLIKIIQLENGKDFIYEAMIALKPEIKLTSYKNLKVKKEKVEVEDKAVEKEMGLLIKRFSDFKDKKEKALNGDRVLIDFSTKLNGEEIKDFKGENEPVIIGGDNLVSVFSQKLRGKKADDEFNFSTVLPRDFKKQGLAGQKVNFSVKVKAVQKIVEPSLKELAQKLGHKKEDELKEKIRQYLVTRKEKEVEKEWENVLMEKIAQKTKLVLPEVLVSQEQERLINQVAQNLAMQGESLDSFLKKVKSDKEEFSKQFKDQAQKNLTFSFILEAIADKEKIKINDKEVQEAIDKERSNLLMQGYQEKDVEQHLNEHAMPQTIKAHLRLNKALDLVKENN